MLFQVEMDVQIPTGIAPDVVEQLKKTERERAQELQKTGQWRHLWRVAGRYANVSIFDVENNEALHDILSTLPLFPFHAHQCNTAVPAPVVDPGGRQVRDPRKRGTIADLTATSYQNP